MIKDHLIRCFVPADLQEGTYKVQVSNFGDDWSSAALIAAYEGDPTIEVALKHSSEASKERLRKRTTTTHLDTTCHPAAKEFIDTSNGILIEQGKKFRHHFCLKCYKKRCTSEKRDRVKIQGWSASRTRSERDRNEIRICII